MRPGKGPRAACQAQRRGTAGHGARRPRGVGARRTVVESHMMDLEGQVALVTGASRGIGRSIALALGDRGATLVGTATTEAGAQTITAYLAEARIRGKGAQLDVPTATSIQLLLAAIDQAHAPGSVLVTNPGIPPANP